MPTPHGYGRDDRLAFTRFPGLSGSRSGALGCAACGGRRPVARAAVARLRGRDLSMVQRTAHIVVVAGPRMALAPADLRINRSLAKAMRRHDYTIRFDSAFPVVIRACAAPRARQPGTWINAEMNHGLREPVSSRPRPQRGGLAGWRVGRWALWGGRSGARFRGIHVQYGKLRLKDRVRGPYRAPHRRRVYPHRLPGAVRAHGVARGATHAASGLSS